MRRRGYPRTRPRPAAFRLEFVVAANRRGEVRGDGDFDEAARWVARSLISPATVPGPALGPALGPDDEAAVRRYVHAELPSSRPVDRQPATGGRSGAGRRSVEAVRPVPAA
ncbi:TetR family transcriptional regulator [Rhodococcus ruber BKS 20-38]|uniref:TetR family transcriptional regulator n=1 Tax=Rhodococcus ruber BKS 20-38 TaxID=1278076 RepID=M3A321_9NOCA|nr:TetR family transcriptional regulator [Rhodococcus ruber BKS 20-38]